ncbi:MAG TPA: biotin/lipoyl-binding protein, partial [Anaerolineales bacterium]
MKMNRWPLFVVLALALAACSGAPSTNAPIPTLVLDPSGSTGGGTPSGASAAGGVSASGEAVPASKINLSFPLTGTVKTVDVKVGDSVSAGEALAALDTTILEARVAEAQAGVDSAATRVRYLRRAAPADEQLNAAIADVDRANAILEQMKAVLAQAALATPMDGTVVSVDITPGESVTPGKVVIVVADLTDMQIETTDLSERDVASVKI